MSFLLWKYIVLLYFHLALRLISTCAKYNEECHLKKENWYQFSDSFLENNGNCVELSAVNKTGSLNIQHAPNQSFPVRTIFNKSKSESSSLQAPGEMGRPYTIEEVSLGQTEMIKAGFDRHYFNEYVSDQISVNRSLPDYRNHWCKRPGLYQDQLLAASVIICFYNEALSALLRTIQSILNRSPDHLLKEIVLVDDNSSFSNFPRNLQDGLDLYLKRHPKIKLIRSSTRLGLIKARMLGARNAQGPILIFLDSHVETTEGWLEPLLHRVTQNWTNVVCPVIDVIDSTTLEYKLTERSITTVGGFNWNLLFVWKLATDDVLRSLKTPAEPVPTPAMAGGLFAIHKNFFDYLGQYDEEYAIWGAENLEISFKTWMCGGNLDIAPCSHVGHIYRHKSPYSRKGSNTQPYRNYIRLAAVWLDEYAKYFYERIGNKLGDYGDISSRVLLKKSLKCKPFEWYIKIVYPDIFNPGNAIAKGEIRNEAFGSKYCLDAVPTFSHTYSTGTYRPKSWPCHNQGGNQHWYYTTKGELRRDEVCLDFAGENKLQMLPCHGQEGNQLWLYDLEDEYLIHIPTQMCLTLDKRDEISVIACEGRITQRWLINNAKYQELQRISQSAAEWREKHTKY